MRKMKSLSTFALLLVTALCSALPPLFDNGRSFWSIYADGNTGKHSDFAVKELRETLQKISGIALPIVKERRQNQIVLQVNPRLPGEDSIQVKRTDTGLLLSAKDEKALCRAVYCFLQKELGVRWCWPGENGEFIPRRTVWNLPEKLDYTYTPQVTMRGFHLCGDWRDVHSFLLWMRRNFINTFRHGGREGMNVMISDHNYRVPKKYFASHPEYFALAQNKRFSGMPCFCSKEAAELIVENFDQHLAKHKDIEILSIFPPDSMTYCECEQCRVKGVSTAYFDQCNFVVKQLKAKYPKVKFATIAYQGYNEVPANKPICDFVEYATYSRCNVHAFDGKCQLNQEILEKMKQWQASGVEMGNYGYEFDIFSGANPRMIPFFSVISDAVKMSVKLNHKVIITEVSLSPKDAPDILSFPGRNRLGLYLYAQMLWQPDSDVRELIRDWCRTVYGKAAEPMYAYWLLLDQSWSSMKLHARIGCDPVALAKEFLTPELQRKVAACFADCDSALGSQKNANVEYDKQLFNQWMTLLRHRHEILLPRIITMDAAASSAAIGTTGIKGHWNDQAIVFSGVQPPADIEITAGIGNGRYIFSISADGKCRGSFVSSVGVADSRFQSKAEYKNNMLIVPFSSLGEKPQIDDSWMVMAKTPSVRYPEEGMAALRFNSQANAGRQIIWWAGGREADKKNHNSLENAFAKNGWKVTFVENAAGYPRERADVYYFFHPDGRNKVPQEIIDRIMPEVAKGAMVIFRSYWQMPIDKYLNNPDLMVKVETIRKIPIGLRKATYLAPGNWLTKPHNIKSIGAVTPAYGLNPKVPGEWHVVAEMQKDGNQDDSHLAFILTRSYGKGLVVVLGESLYANAAIIVDNLNTNRADLLNAPRGK